MNSPHSFSRRTFLKGSLAAVISAGIGSSLTLDKTPFRPAAAEASEQVFQSACPRNCYDSCSVLSTVKDGVLKYVEGNPANTYTHGRLCAKGFSYTRLRQPRIRLGELDPS